MSDELLVSTEGHVMVIRMNRPAARNAMNEAMAFAMADALTQLDSDDALRAAVLTGEGGTFCSGMDLKAFTRGERPWVPGRGFGGFVERPPVKPIIAAVEGYAVAGGCEISLACDLIVAADNASFGLPEVKRGLVASAGGLMRLPRQLPYHLAMELVLTGEILPASTAHAHGLINRLVAPGQALATALALANQISSNAPLALIASKRIMSQSVAWSPDEMFKHQAPMADPVVNSDDAQEGARAFAEKRAPVWLGR